MRAATILMAALALISLSCAPEKGNGGRAASNPEAKASRPPEREGAPGQARAWIQDLTRREPELRAEARKKILREADRNPANVFPALSEALKSRDSDLSSGAAAVLAEMGPKAVMALPALAGALSDDASSVSRNAIRNVLNGIGEEMIVQTARQHPDLETRVAALYALGMTGTRRTEALIAALKDDKREIRSMAAGSLGSLARPDPEIASALVEALKDPDEHTRMNAAWALSQSGTADPATLAALEQTAAADSNSHARDNARKALNALKSNRR